MTCFDRDKCVVAMEELLDKIKDEISGTIYHYTDYEGLKGIIESNEIWMTNALFVNDKTELRTSLKWHDTFKQTQFINPEFNIFKNEREYESKDIENYYLFSFSRDGNSLDQFRAYGNYCIGFEANKLKDYVPSFFECLYSKEDIKKWIIEKDLMKEWQNECFNNEEGSGYKESAFLNLLFAIQAKLKNEYYKSEREVRLLSVSNSSWSWYTKSSEMFCEQPAIYFRNNKLLNALIPYVKFFIPKKKVSRKELEYMVKGKSRLETKQIIKKMEMEQERDYLPINEVRIGPMQYQEELMSTIRIFLLEKGYDKVKITSSEIPFRGN